MLAPAGLAWLLTLVLPSLLTVITSFERNNALSRPSFAGLTNYGQLLPDTLLSLAAGVAVAIVPVIVVAVVAPLAAAGAQRSGAGGQRIVRIAFCVGIASFAPAAFSASLLATLGFLGGGLLAIVLVTAIASVAALLGIGGLASLAALRSPGPRAVLLVAGLAAIATLAYVLQSFTFGYVFGGRSGPTTPAALIFRTSVVYYQFGAAAVPATALGVVLGLLGIGALALILASRMRISVGEAAASGRKTVGYIAVAAAVLVVVVAQLPWIIASFGGGHPVTNPFLTLLNTIGPSFLSATVQVGLAFLGGFGIGGLRPLGRFSELLLIPFAPWLFVTAAPLSVADFQIAHAVGSLNTWIGLISPVLVNVPALVFFTLLFAGQRARSGGDLFGTVIVPALPAAAAVWMISWLVESVATVWPLLVGSDQKVWTGAVNAIAGAQQYVSRIDPVSLWLAAPLGVLALVVLAALQLTHLHRLQITLGDAPQPTGPRSPEPDTAVTRHGP